MAFKEDPMDPSIDRGMTSNEIRAVRKFLYQVDLPTRDGSYVYAGQQLAKLELQERAIKNRRSIMQRAWEVININMAIHRFSSKVADISERPILIGFPAMLASGFVLKLLPIPNEVIDEIFFGVAKGWATIALTGLGAQFIADKTQPQRKQLIASNITSLA